MSVLDTSLGAILIGTFLNVWLYGIVIVQVSFYYAFYRQPSDNIWVKLVVAWLTLLETLITVFHTGFVYRYTITLFGNFGALAHSHWFFHMSPLLTVTIASTVQGFFAWRISRLTGRTCISVAIGALMITQFVAGAVTTAGAFRVVDFARFNELRAPVILWLVTSAVTDVLITCVLTWHLHTRRTGFSRTDDLITKLIGLTVQTGLVTSVWAVVDLAVFMAVPTPLHLLFNLPLCKLYTSSLLSTLNARGGLEGSTTGPQSAQGISLPGSFGRDKASSRVPEHYQYAAPSNRLSKRAEIDADKASFELGEYSKSQRRPSIDTERGDQATIVVSTVQLQLPAKAHTADDWPARSRSSSDINIVT